MSLDELADTSELSISIKEELRRSETVSYIWTVMSVVADEI
jgi:hypothetical protein